MSNSIWTLVNSIQRLSPRAKLWIAFPAILLSVIVAFSVAKTSDQYQTVRVTVHFRLPSQEAAKSRRDESVDVFAAPVVDGCADPNLIAYDSDYIKHYVSKAIDGVTICGVAECSLATPNGEIKIPCSLDEAYLGSSFKQEKLIQFLNSRINSPAKEREFTVAVTIPRDKNPSSVPKVDLSPWDRDIVTVMRLLAKAQSKPAYPLLVALTKDNSRYVRSEAIMALGEIASVEPRAIGDIENLISNPELLSDVMAAFKRAGDLGVTALIKAMDNPNPLVRNQAVFALPWVSPPAASGRGILAALRHEDPLVRSYGKSALSDLLSRGAQLPSDLLEEIQIELKKL